MREISMEKLRQDILYVLRFLYQTDGMLIKCKTNERCIAARFFAYMMNHTCGDKAYGNDGELDWDPEYNRKGLEGEAKDMRGDGKYTNIIPDLILHHRGDDSKNVLAIEFKTVKGKRRPSLKEDGQKLAYLTGSAYRYQYGVNIVLDLDRVEMIWFRDGDETPYSYEAYSTKTWSSTSFLASNRQPERRRNCTLMITRACNLNCAYCYEPYKCQDHKTDMTFETAKAILKKEFDFVSSGDEYDEIEIDFMGGEPLMNFPLIKQVVEWLEKEPPTVPFVCFATTNGTLVHKHAAWLRQHTKSLWLGASYDGTPEMQRVNRGTGERFENNLELIHEIYPAQPFHMVISKETLPMLAEGVLSVQRKGWQIDAALAQGVDWNEKDAEQYRRQLEKLAKVYLKDRDLIPVNLLTRPLVSVSDDPKTVKQEKFCGTGTHMVTYDYDGKAYGCHLFTPVVLGDRAIEASCIDYSCADVQEDPECATCRLKSICPTCAGFNYRYRDALGRRDHRWCKMIAEQMRVACAFQIKWLAHQRHMTAEEIAYAKSAVEAWKFLENLEIFGTRKEEERG